jgi:hypothetical protein
MEPNVAIDEERLLDKRGSSLKIMKIHDCDCDCDHCRRMIFSRNQFIDTEMISNGLKLRRVFLVDHRSNAERDGKLESHHQLTARSLKSMKIA